MNSDQKDPKKEPKISRYDEANLLSKLYCWYVFGFMRQFYRKPFDLDVIDKCSRKDNCDMLGDRIRKTWMEEVNLAKKGKTASLPRAMLKSYGFKFFKMSLTNVLVHGLIRMVMPLALGEIICFANLYREELVPGENMTQTSSLDPSPSPLNATTQPPVSKTNNVCLAISWLDFSNKEYVIFYTVLLCALILINFLISQPYFMETFRLGMQIRVALTRLVYEKALRITNNAIQRITVGKIVNLISNDASRFDLCFTAVFFVYLAPLHTMIAMAFLYLYIGRACLGTLAIIVFYIPLQGVMADILSRFRSKSILLTDDRLRLMAEILPAMRVIKMYVWEKPFSLLVHMARKAEIYKIRQSMILRSINLAIFFVSNKLMSFICIIIYLLDDNQLNAKIVFVSLSLIFQIREVMTYFFPVAISFGVESYISVKRIEKFLLEDETPDEKTKLLTSGIELGSNIESKLALQKHKNSISLKNVSVKSELDGTSILNDISFDVVPGHLTVIIGPVGSGKSSVLLSILDEMPLSSGTINVRGKLIYASQEAWIFNGTVRENILFGLEYDAKRYRKIVKVAALESDFDQLPQADQTLVDDRGTSLSGGQRARISLARALYTDADCYLLDDPLSAVDAAVAKHIFEKCIKEFLKNKCVILVTHQLQFVKAADQIVVLKNGYCLASGPYNLLLNKGIDLFKYSASEPLEQPAEDHIPVATVSRPLTTATSTMIAPYRFRVDSFNSDIFRSRTSSMCSDLDSSTHDNVSILDYTSANPVSPTSTDPVAVDNTQFEGGVTGTRGNTFKIYWVYIRLGAGFLLLSTFFISNLMTQVLFTGTDYWLSAWTDYQENVFIASNVPNYTFHRNPIIQESQNANIITYSALVIILFGFAIIRTTSFFVTCMRASVNLHNTIFTSLIQAPIVFFDKTPVGIIMNRVSRDLGIIDDILPPNAFEALEILGNSLAVFVLCATLNYFILIPFFLLVILLYLDMKFYVNTARDLRRLEATARSPLFNQMASTLAGLPTIRSYQAQKMFIERFSKTQDVHSSTLFTFLSASRLFGISLEVMCVVYIYCLVISLILNLDLFTGSVIGLIISQSLTLTTSFNWGVRQYTEVETYMTSVERVIEFGKLDKEPLEECKQEPNENWPPRGDIVFEDVCLSYSFLDEPVLKNLTFTIRGGEKIGIVGRTGAGKSSIITTLFRLTQPTGSIVIDGIDTGSISLSRLRKSLSIIPQEPILFSGNIRRNLDPFNEKSDAELWDAVEKVQLKTKIQSFPAKLDSPVSDTGSDFSVGQKQLICLARAILRKNRVLVLDEATANVDPKTDSLIQETIRSEFEQCTVLTIAHRLNTIIDYDRVLVLDKGKLMQFDTPYNLITKESGIFYELFNNLNQDMKNELFKIAKKSNDRIKFQFKLD